MQVEELNGTLRPRTVSKQRGKTVFLLDALFRDTSEHPGALRLAAVAVVRAVGRRVAFVQAHVSELGAGRYVLRRSEDDVHEVTVPVLAWSGVGLGLGFRVRLRLRLRLRVSRQGQSSG